MEGQVKRMDRCQRCRLRKEHCLCAEITRAQCEVDICVLRHSLEAKRSSNTGRLVGRSLQGATLVDYANPLQPLDFEQLVPENTWLLYPTLGAKVPEKLPKRLIVLDGSWSQARKMAQRIAPLRSLPCLALPPPTQALPRMRKGAKPEQMSTAESVIAALRVMKQWQAADHLERLLRELVHRFSVPSRQGRAMQKPL